MAAGNRQVTASTVFTPVLGLTQPTGSYMWAVAGTISHANPAKIANGHYRVTYRGDLDPTRTSVTCNVLFGTTAAGGDRSAFAVLTRNSPAGSTTIDIFVTQTSTGVANDGDGDTPMFVEVSLSRLPQ